MPDWSYQTVFRPLVFRMAPATARDLALGSMGLLSRLPLGPTLIEFLGHMQPDRRLQCAVGGMAFPTRVGLGGAVDQQLLGTGALSRFGVAFVEIGPVTVEPIPGGPIARDDRAETVSFHAPAENPGLDVVSQRLENITRARVLLRLSDRSSAKATFERDAVRIVDRLGKQVSGLVFDLENPAASVIEIERLSRQSRAHGPRLVLIAVPADADDGALQTAGALAEQKVIDGVLVDGRTHDSMGRCSLGRQAFPQVRQLVERLRQRLPPGTPLIAGGGIHEPVQALDLLDAGADLIAIDTGLVFTGPGLAKRINDAILSRVATACGSAGPVRPVESAHFARQSWFWTLLMGLGMLGGGFLALVIAATRVVMPYDEAAVGMTRHEMAEVNDHLLHFMRHDRMTLAGTMLAVGTLYTVLSFYGSRRGLHWPHTAIVASAFAGFASFFLFLGFGYFDPFHAFVTGALLQLLLLAVHCGPPSPLGESAGEVTVQGAYAPRSPIRYDSCADLHNDRAWRLSQWGQLLFIVHGAVLIVAGCVIASVGISTVFVPEDLEFMQTTSDHLIAASPHLVPLVAHDRATFGGMLLACGVCVLLSSLWGFRRGHAWLWWALMIGGSAAYLATVYVHWQVGYTSLKHLIPAYAGLAGLMVGGALSREYLCATPARDERR